MRKRIGSAILALWMLIAAGCGSLGPSGPQQQFLQTFALEIDPTSIQAEERYDSYGFHGDGIALYVLTFSQDCTDAFASWQSLPLSEESTEFLEGIRTYVELPQITRGKWALVDRSPEEARLTNVSFCMYGLDARTAYFVTVDT
ncbi:MAG TPA: hypothetical protein IAC21_00860 [Candidatus Enterenecus merdae]|nr:hypothetical protein [Candidatus Enterenecus merdae]